MFRGVVSVPGARGVAPRAMYRAAEGADEVSGSSGVHAFALEGIELFVDREFHRWCEWFCRAAWCRTLHGAVGGAVFGVFQNFGLRDPGASFCVFTYHDVEDAVQVLG